MWRSLKSIIIGKQDALPNEIQFGNRLISDETEISNCFNEFFIIVSVILFKVFLLMIMMIILQIGVKRN